MGLPFDPRKDVINKRKHGISLERAEDFDLMTAHTIVDDSEQYGEVRYRSIGFLDANLYVFVFTETETGIRAISLRAAEKSEQREYAENF